MYSNNYLSILYLAQNNWNSTLFITSYICLFHDLGRILILFKAMPNVQSLLKVKTSIGNAPISKNEMEALITNHVKEYVLTNI